MEARPWDMDAPVTRIGRPSYGNIQVSQPLQLSQDDIPWIEAAGGHLPTLGATRAQFGMDDRRMMSPTPATWMPRTHPYLRTALS